MFCDVSGFPVFELICVCYFRMVGISCWWFRGLDLIGLGLGLLGLGGSCGWVCYSFRVDLVFGYIRLVIWVFVWLFSWWGWLV